MAKSEMFYDLMYMEDKFGHKMTGSDIDRKLSMLSEKEFIELRKEVQEFYDKACISASGDAFWTADCMLQWVDDEYDRRLHR